MFDRFLNSGIQFSNHFTRALWSREKEREKEKEKKRDKKIQRERDTEIEIEIGRYR